jgi:hypothetical protein
MSLDKAIEHGKEHRKPYRDADAVHDFRRCKYCKDGRLHRNRKRERTAREQIEEWRTG